MSPERRPGVIAVLFGPPGSGKGTQSGFIASTFDLVHVSTGEVLRDEVRKGSELGKEVEPIMTSGELVPDDLIVRVIEERLREEDARGGVLLDGFPRTLPQAQSLDVMLDRAGRRVDIVLYLDVPEETLRERILQRGKAEDRADDTPDTVATRLQVYESDTAPVLEYYEGRRTNVQHVNGVGSIDEVQDRIRKAFDSIMDGTAV